MKRELLRQVKAQRCNKKKMNKKAKRRGKLDEQVKKKKKKTGVKRKESKVF